MKTKFLLVICFIFLIDLSAQTFNKDSLELKIQKVIKDFDIPGLSIGVVRNDSVIFCKGYGLLEIGKSELVNTNTIFGIGYISKSFTAMTLGILVGQGELNWDDKVIGILPYFELYDPWVTKNFTIRDLLTHRSGLKEVSGGTLWYHSKFNRQEIIKRLKYLKPESGFREKPAYQNVMYMVAGEVVAEVAGTSWDEFLQLEVFDKIKMGSSTSLSQTRESNNNLARPHIWDDNYKKASILQESGDNLSPAGFIYSSAEDMANYMKLILNNGILGQDTIVQPKVIQEILKPQIIYPFMGEPFSNEFTSYGLGWWLTPKKGHKIIEHSGGIDGMSANLVMIQDMDTGFVILTNDGEEPAVFALTARILESLLEDSSYNIYDEIREYRNNSLREKRMLSEQLPEFINTTPSLNIKSFLGTYVDEMYGDIEILQREDLRCEILFTNTPLFKGQLEHWQYDTFKIDWYDIRLPDGYLTFNFNAGGEIVGFTINQENLLDVDFGELKIMKK